MPESSEYESCIASLPDRASSYMQARVDFDLFPPVSEKTKYPKKKGQEMRQKIVREGNAFYEIDDECMRKKEEQKKKKEFQAKDSTSSKKEH